MSVVGRPTLPSAEIVRFDGTAHVAAKNMVANVMTSERALGGCCRSGGGGP